MKYNRNINVKNYSSIEDIYDSVNNDPKRPGFQIVFLDRADAFKSRENWIKYLWKNGYPNDTISEKRPKLNGIAYNAIIIEATPEQATALKICF